jgi:hypothetical protein
MRTRRGSKRMVSPRVLAILAARPGDHGRVVYVTTDGGTTAPPGGIVRNGALLLAELG